MLIKPEKIYADPIPSPDVHEAVKQLSFAEKLELYTRLQKELNPTITPALGDEEVREMVLDEWEGKLDIEEEQVEEPKEEKPSINPYTIRFNPPGTEFGKPMGWEKPPGWDKKPKKTSIFKVFVWGMIDKDMEVVDYKRYDTLMSWMRPVVIIISIALIALFVYTGLRKDTGVGDRHTTFIDHIFNWGRSLYDSWFNNTKVPTNTNSQVVTDSPFTKLLTVPKDTPVVNTIKDSTFTIDSSLILIDTIK